MGNVLGRFARGFFLTIGIRACGPGVALLRNFGWGGFLVLDPVENASFMPMAYCGSTAAFGSRWFLKSAEEF